jgi:uncharacterized protein YqeY
MTLEQLHNDMVTAWKGGDINRKKVLSDTIAHIKRAAIDKGCRDNIKEDFIDAELLKVQKMFKEMVDTCPDDRETTKEEYTLNLAIINEYVPKLIVDEEKIIEIIRDEYEGPLTKPCLMKFLTTNYKGKMDMKIASGVVTELVTPKSSANE